MNKLGNFKELYGMKICRFCASRYCSSCLRDKGEYDAQ